MGKRSRSIPLELASSHPARHSIQNILLARVPLRISFSSAQVRCQVLPVWSRYLFSVRPSFTPTQNNRSNYSWSYFNLCVFTQQTKIPKILKGMVGSIPRIYFLQEYDFDTFIVVLTCCSSLSCNVVTRPDRLCFLSVPMSLLNSVQTIMLPAGGQSWGRKVPSVPRDPRYGLLKIESSDFVVVTSLRDCEAHSGTPCACGSCYVSLPDASPADVAPPATSLGRLP
jgi:hypothetical protein